MKKCKTCKQEITAKKFHVYCSSKCRNKFHNNKAIRSGKSKEYQRKLRDKEALIPSNKKVKCLICNKWYVQLGSHVVQRHGYKSCREYREEMGLDVKRGIIPNWYRELKGEQAIENKTYKNLKAGKKYWFKKGDKKAGNYIRSLQTIERLKKLTKKI